MHELKAIIFDMDGTLADTEDIHRQAFNRAFSEYDLGWQWSFEEYRELLAISGGRERIRQYLDDQQTEPRDGECLDELARLIHNRKSDIYREMLVEGCIPLRKGVVRLINEARDENMTLAIATSSCRMNVETLLCNTLGTNAVSLFSVIVSADTVTEKKPSPAAYRQALLELELPAHACIAIEDTRNGNRAARAANLPTVITTHPYTVDDDFSGAGLVVDQLGEPEAGFSVIAGDSFSKDLVDLELLRKIHDRQTNNAGEETWNSTKIAVATGP